MVGRSPTPKSRPRGLGLSSHGWQPSFLQAVVQAVAEDMDGAELMPRGMYNNIARRVELYHTAYKLAWDLIPTVERRARPDISLRIHASIRRQLKAGAIDAHTIAFTALKDVLVPDTP